MIESASAWHDEAAAAAARFHARGLMILLGCKRMHALIVCLVAKPEIKPKLTREPS